MIVTHGMRNCLLRRIQDRFRLDPSWNLYDAKYRMGLGIEIIVRGRIFSIPLEWREWEDCWNFKLKKQSRFTIPRKLSLRKLRYAENDGFSQRIRGTELGTNFTRAQLAWKWKSIRQHDNSFRRPGVMDYRLPGQASNSQPFRFLEILASVFNSLPLIRNPPSTNSADLPRPASAAGKLKRTKFQQDQSSPSISTASPASSREENKERTKMVVFLFSLASVFRSLFSRNVRAYPFFFSRVSKIF